MLLNLTFVFTTKLEFSSSSLSIYFDFPFDSLKKIIVDVSTIFVKLFLFREYIYDIKYFYLLNVFGIVHGIRPLQQYNSQMN
jgi:hypothetical protein